MFGQAFYEPAHLNVFNQYSEKRQNNKSGDVHGEQMCLYCPQLVFTVWLRWTNYQRAFTDDPASGNHDNQGTGRPQSMIRDAGSSWLAETSSVNVRSCLTFGKKFYVRYKHGTETLPVCGLITAHHRLDHKNNESRT